MTNVAFESIHDYRDIETLNTYREAVEKGAMDPGKVMESIHRKSRDNARTPMQWNDEANAGFTAGKPWIGVNPNYKDINVKKALEDKDSIFYYYKNLIRLRKEYPVIVYGEYIPLLEDDEEIFSYIRRLDNESILVILNFSCGVVKYEIPFGLALDNRQILISNYNADRDTECGEIELKPYEARVYKLLSATA